jgi:hypothetical protein
VEEVAELGDDEGGGGSGAEDEDHAGLDVVHGLVGGKLLEVVLREDWSEEGFDEDGFAVCGTGCVGERGFGLRGLRGLEVW